jgi:predicted nucleic acid-binding Zn finger protein
MYSLNEKLLAETQKKLREGETFDSKSLAELRSKFGEKLDRAFKLVEDGHVKKYTFQPSKRGVWIVVGRTRDYQVLPRLYCMCDDFYLNVIIRRSDPACYHILAQMLAEASHKFDKIEERDGKYDLFMQEWANPTEEQSA